MSTRRFGLIGKNISYSFSKQFFTEKFEIESLEDCSYENFDINTISEFQFLIKNNTDIKGLNITIPYKESIIPYLDKLSMKAAKIGAVNVIRKTSKGKLKGYNSDYYGFMKSLQPLLKSHHKKALILGTGGAAKAIAFALDQLGIDFLFVSRTNKKNMIGYDQLTTSVFDDHHIIINCTPVGTSTANHIAFDLIYNPEETEFLKRAKANGAVTKNGFEMLVKQAEKAWKIWNK
jgi:shikimate dehydrogenase